MTSANHSSLLGLFGGTVLCLILAACSGGGGGGGNSSSGSGGSAVSSSSSSSAVSAGAYSSAANTVKLTVDNTFHSINHLYTSVKICAPGSTTNCKTVDHVLVDTGSSGLRLMASALSSSVINALNPLKSVSNLPVQECMLFGSGHAWGAIKYADLTIGEKTANNLALQVINDGSYSEPSSGCGDTGTSYTLPTELGANGILGIGAGLQDCGTLCAVAGTSVYFTCTSSSGSSCSRINLGTSSQLQNPVSQFSSDKNGVVISLPDISADTGADVVTGTLMFGIDTQSNNQSTSITAYGTDSSGFVGQTSYTPLGTTVLSTYSTSIIDSGSNAYFFRDSKITRCTSPNQTWYCQTLALSANVTSKTTTIPSKLVKISFNLTDRTNSLFNSGRVAFNNVGAYGSSDEFIFGLPFFYGRKVFVAFDGQSTLAGTGPYVGY